ncbi:MAG: hypothetical protein KDC84_15855, partial [Crocinitomicaceae bacterium]|nr:hypothetical protein [Crocinitomicaceae bacterium]
MIIYTPIYRVDYSSLSKYCEEHFENIKSKNTLDDVPEYKIWIPTQALGGRADEVGSDLRFKIIKKRKGLFLKVRVSNIQFNLFAILLNCVVGCLSYFVAKSFIHIIYSLVVTLIVYYIYR